MPKWLGLDAYQHRELRVPIIWIATPEVATTATNRQRQDSSGLKKSDRQHQCQSPAGNIKKLPSTTENKGKARYSLFDLPAAEVIREECIAPIPDSLTRQSTLVCSGDREYRAEEYFLTQMTVGKERQWSIRPPHCNSFVIADCPQSPLMGSG